eukprot:Em0011g355a
MLGLNQHIVHFSTHRIVGISTLSRQQHRVVQTREVACTKIVLPQVIARGLNITEVAHDYQATIKQKVQQLGVVNSYDTWYGTKNVAKQLRHICAGTVRTRDRTWFTELSDKGMYFPDILIKNGISGYSARVITKVAILRVPVNSQRSFGKTKPVFCSAKSQWFDTWPFLHYDEGQDVMFCHTCVTAFKLGRIKSSKNAATAFVTSGFCNWKDATVAFSKHLQSKSHIEAVEAVITLPKQTKDVGAQLSIAHKAEKEEARDMCRLFCQVFASLPGKDWPFVVMAAMCPLTSLSFFMDQSNKEQLTLVLRWVSDDFTVSEEFVGLYYLSVIGAQSIVDAIKDAFLRFQIPFTKLRGLQNENDFELFWQKIEKMRVQFDIDEPLLPRKRKVSQRFETGIAPAEFATSTKDEYRRVFFECFDLAVMSIRSRFDQKGFKTFFNVEQLFFKACKGQNYEEELDFVCNFFTNDFNKIELAAELLTLRTLYGTEIAADEKPSVNSIKTALLALNTMQRKLLGAVVRLFQLLVTLPATNATSERSFSALRRIKSYLRSTMSQACTSGGCGQSNSCSLKILQAMPTSQAAPNVTALNAVTALSNTADPLNPSVPNGIITACNVRQRSTALWKQHAPQLDVRLVVLPMSQHWIVHLWAKLPPHPQYHILFHVPPMECSPPTRLCHHCLTLHHRVPSLKSQSEMWAPPSTATVQFHAYNPSGILFYQINSVITDFLGVKMHGGLPWLIFDVGSGPAVVGSNSTRTFIDGQWHTGHVVLFEQASNTFYVTVDTVHAAAITDVIVPLLIMKVYFEGFPSTRADMALQPLTACVLSPPEWYLAPDGFDAVSVQNVGSTYIIVSWDLPTHSNGILINFSLYCNGALAGVLPLTVISYNTTGPFTSTCTCPPVTPAGTALQLEHGVGRHQCCSQPAQVVAPGHKEHEEPLAMSIPNHWMENYSSLGSKFRSRLGGMQHEVLTQRAAKPCQQVMMLSTTMRTGSSSFFDSTL